MSTNQTNRGAGTNPPIPPAYPPTASEIPKKVRKTLWFVVGAGIGGLLIGGLFGAGTSAGPMADLESANASQTRQITELRTEIETKAAQVAEAESAASKASASADAAIAEMETSIAAQEETLASRQEELDTAEAEQKQAQKEFDAAVKDRESNTFGRGIFEVGVDVKPGKYKTSGPDGSNPVGCYYAWLDSSDADADILNNNIVNGKATATLKNGQFFENSSCEDFVKQ